MVMQFHFTAWPDHGVPDYATAILMFHSKVLESHGNSNGPLLVHCRLKSCISYSFIKLLTFFYLICVVLG